MLKNWSVAVVIVAFVLAAPLSAYSADKPGGAKSAENDDAVRSILMGLEQAFTSKSAENAGAFFSDDAQFIDQAGDEIRGRKALQERFDQLFKSASKPVIGIHPQQVTFLAENVVLVTGEVSHKHDGDFAPASRFSMVMVKQEKRWLIKEITETAIQSAQSESHLQELSWLIGHWLVEKTDAGVELSVEWAPGKKFITSKTTLRKNGRQPEIDTQVIGWDPQHNAIISWHFDSNGGFGNGTWSQLPGEKKWIVDVIGVGADGSNTTASNVFSPKAPDEFLWQSIRRSLDGAAVADTEAITVHRLKQ